MNDLFHCFLLTVTERDCSTLPDITSIYSILDHTADLRIRITGNSLMDLFHNAGKAFLHLLFRVRSVENSSYTSVSLIGNDLEDLLVRWLSEILYLFEGEGLVVFSFKIDSLLSTVLKATLGTTPFDPKNHEILREIKAVTYHQIEIMNKKDTWEAQVTFDL